ncbi:MAG TPA: Crp/Fnr family transcriptional regulator [Chitinophagaceae bacterium]|jgi:CRP/FNR family transcriptional regulator|nr:Crp/Fnr family transcriptional regulator [Chitinophagaceae bacterium]
MTIDERFLLIRNYDLWSQLSDEEYEELNVDHHFIEAKKGDYIYFDSHYLNRLYFVKDGFIKIGYVDEEGNEIIKEIIREGEVFGQFTLEKNNLHGEFARAYKADVSLCSFTIDDFEKLLKKKPEIAIRYSRQMGQKLRNAEFRLLSLLNKDVRSRLLSFFYQLAVQNGYSGEDGIFSMDNFLTHDDIAGLIGSARQTVTTFINILEAEGLVKITRKHITLPDVKKIQKQVIVT